MASTTLTFSDLPRAIKRPLTISEVAAITDVDRKVVNRMIDDRVLPKSVVVVRRAPNNESVRRFLKPPAVPMVLLTASTANLVSNKMCRMAFERIVSMIREDIGTAVLDAGALSLDLSGVMSDALTRMLALARAEADVEIDPDVRGGAPVMRGTRILVHELANLAEADGIEPVIDGYPTLTADRLENAMIYAKAHPLIGRPRKRPASPDGARIVSSAKIDLGAL